MTIDAREGSIVRGHCVAIGTDAPPAGGMMAPGRDWEVCVVVPCRWLPGRCGVAGLAIQRERSCGMRRARGCVVLRQVTCRITTSTWCPGVDPVLMARCAWRCEMRASERETRLAVVESCGLPCIRAMAGSTIC